MLYHGIYLSRVVRCLDFACKRCGVIIVVKQSQRYLMIVVEDQNRGLVLREEHTHPGKCLPLLLSFRFFFFCRFCKMLMNSTQVRCEPSLSLCLNLCARMQFSCISILKLSLDEFKVESVGAVVRRLVLAMTWALRLSTCYSQCDARCLVLYGSGGAILDPPNKKTKKSSVHQRQIA
jgi:hypothetical protein